MHIFYMTSQLYQGWVWMTDAYVHSLKWVLEPRTIRSAVKIPRPFGHSVLKKMGRSTKLSKLEIRMKRGIMVIILLGQWSPLIHKLSSTRESFYEQVERRFEQYICCSENDSRVLDSLCVNGDHWPRDITIIPLKWNASK